MPQHVIAGLGEAIPSAIAVQACSQSGIFERRESHARGAVRDAVQVLRCPAAGWPDAVARDRDIWRFYVDDYEVGDVGSCNLDSWVSFASNHDFTAVTSPSCVVKIGVPVEIGTEVQRSRENEEWKSSAGVSGKVTLLPMTNHVGVGLSGEADWNLLSGASTGGSINVPVTFDLGHGLHLNVNGGWLYDATTKTNYVTWGTRMVFTVTPTVALIGDVFGQAGPRGETASITEPRFQTGIRFTPPGSNLDLTAIYGRNLNGENANWLTLGVSFGFDAD